jgi:hypothetical protein
MNLGTLYRYKSLEKSGASFFRTEDFQPLPWRHPILPNCRYLTTQGHMPPQETRYFPDPSQLKRNRLLQNFFRIRNAQYSDTVTKNAIIHVVILKTTLVTLFYNTVTYLMTIGTGFGLVIGFIGLLKHVTGSTYSAIANSHILQFTTASTNSSQSSISSPVVAW